ncbi:hypothetical protein [Geomonas ferrireducens]|uniref:hypothetical protein n=1 Tax=Geomonas ferrireducens TaxID=2570227 RepID=UPI0013A5C9D0|nr:hypothetical protein [Geomonas ferrireducens]
MSRESESIFEGIGCLIALVATVMSIASIPFLGPIPIAVVFGIGYSLYKSKGKL